MPGTNEYYDFLYAYALGCLSNSELKKLQDYLQTSTDFPWEELGEFQNIISLLPSILSSETPNPRLKDNVARKLYKLKKEGLTKTHVRQNTRPTPIKEERIIPEERKEMNIASKGKLGKKPDGDTYYPIGVKNIGNELKVEKHITADGEFQAVTPKKKMHIPVRPSYNTQIRLRVTDEGKEEIAGTQKDPHPTDEEIVNDSIDLSKKKRDERFYKTHPTEQFVDKKKPKPTFQNTSEEPQKKNHVNIIVTIAILAFVLAGLIFMYFKISSDVTGYKQGVEKLNQQISDLSSQVNTNQDLQKLLASKNVKIINLTGTSLAKGGYGKIIMSLEEKKGYLQLFNMPNLNEGKSYELWINITGKLLALGVFKSQNNIEYFPFSIPFIPDKASVLFYLTETPSGNSLKPFGNIYLSGKLQ
jgi:cell division protein FtsL